METRRYCCSEMGHKFRGPVAKYTNVSFDDTTIELEGAEVGRPEQTHLTNKSEVKNFTRHCYFSQLDVKNNVVTRGVSIQLQKEHLRQTCAANKPRAIDAH